MLAWKLKLQLKPCPQDKAVINLRLSLLRWFNSALFLRILDATC